LIRRVTFLQSIDEWSGPTIAGRDEIVWPTDYVDDKQSPGLAAGPPTNGDGLHLSDFGRALERLASLFCSAGVRVLTGLSAFYFS
jgi:hypothetical protein